MAGSDSNLEVSPHNSIEKASAKGAGVSVSEGGKMKRRRRKSWQGGSIFPRPSGFTIVYRKPDGKQKWEGGFRTKALAQDRLNEVLGQIKDKKFLEPKEKLFSAWCDEWLESKKRQLKPSTWGSYYSAVTRWLKPEFGNSYVGDITRPAVVLFFRGLAAEKSRYGKRRLTHKFIKNLHTLLHAIFDAAMEEELTATNPAHMLEKIISQLGEDSSERVVPRREEVVKTFENLGATYQVLFATGAVTGLRRGELLGLRWSDLNLETGMLSVSHNLQRVKKVRLTEDAHKGVERIGSTGLALVKPKSKKSVRDVEIPPKLAAMLRELRRRQTGDSAFVFRDEIGRPLDPDAIYDVLHAAQDRAEVRPFGLHGLRHLYCSLLQESGASLKHAQERMGHASAATTMEIYTHSVTDEGRKYAERVEAEFPFVGNLLLEEAVR